MEILLAEDEADVRDALALRLADAGYAVRTARDGAEALALFRACRPDLLLLDVRMPKKSGYDVCAEVRAADARVPIVFLTAFDDAASELHGLELAADDYVSKTAPTDVLLARLAGLLRRASADEAASTGDFAFGSHRVDAAGGRLVSASGRVVEISLRAVEVLRWFAAHPNETASRDFLLTRFWGRDTNVEENAVDVLLSRLRAKLGPDGRLIETAYGKGYRYTPPISNHRHSKKTH